MLATLNRFARLIRPRASATDIPPGVQRAAMLHALDGNRNADIGGWYEPTAARSADAHAETWRRAAAAANARYGL